MCALDCIRAEEIKHELREPRNRVGLVARLFGQPATQKVDRVDAMPGRERCYVCVPLKHRATDAVQQNDRRTLEPACQYRVLTPPTLT